jgi:hypothetical protein
MEHRDLHAEWSSSGTAKTRECARKERSTSIPNITYAASATTSLNYGALCRPSFAHQYLIDLRYHPMAVASAHTAQLRIQIIAAARRPVGNNTSASQTTQPIRIETSANHAILSLFGAFATRNR